MEKNGTMDKQNFWKLKRALAPKTLRSHNYCEGISDISDSINIMSEYRNECQHRLRNLT